MEICGQLALEAEKQAAFRRSKLHCISFGSSKEYIDLSKNIIADINSVYPHAACVVYTPSDLPKDLLRFCIKHKRGWGYWAWKPYVIRKHLELLEEGDVMLYVDGRCGLVNKGKGISWLDTFISGSNYDLATWQLPLPEQDWTSEDVFNLLGQSENMPVRLSGQYAGGLHCWRTGDKCRNMAKLWELFINTYPNRFMDGPFEDENIETFNENRHDQSLFSVLLKVLQLKNKISVKSIQMDEYSSGNLIAHMQKHPLCVRCRRGKQEHSFQ